MLFTESLRKNYDYQKVYKNGMHYADRFLVIYIVDNNREENRLGISVSKKVGNSVIRHRVKRLIKESYRKQEYKFKIGYDIVIVARSSSKDASFFDICNSLRKLSIKCEVYSKW